MSEWVSYKEAAKRLGYNDVSNFYKQGFRKDLKRREGKKGKEVVLPAKASNGAEQPIKVKFAPAPTVLGDLDIAFKVVRGGNLLPWAYQVIAQAILLGRLVRKE